MKKKMLLVGIVMVGCAGVWACSGDDSGTDGGSDSGADATTSDSGGQDSGGQDATGQDSGGQDSGGGDAANDSGGGGDAGDAGLVNNCVTFVDMTADGGFVQGPTGNAPVQYVPNCVHIKPGQSVTWNSKFSAHPLQASGGTTPSPITTTNSGTTVTFTFPNAGTYGFDCQVHPTIMNGAVEVK